MTAKVTFIKLMSENGATEWNLEVSHATRLLRAFGHLYSLPADSEYEFIDGELKKKSTKKAK